MLHVMPQLRHILLRTATTCGRSISCWEGREAGTLEAQEAETGGLIAARGLFEWIDAPARIRTSNQQIMSLLL